MSTMELGLYFKKLRLDLGWSQEDLAVAASAYIEGIKQSDISRLESGRSGSETLTAVMKTLLIPVDHLVKLQQKTVSAEDVDRLVSEWRTLSAQELSYLRRLPKEQKARIVRRGRQDLPPENKHQ